MISIIVPIYNTEQYLAQCIDSLLCQTQKDLQIILVDDQSTDESLTIAQSYAQKDKRIELYQQTHAGQSAARNTGLQHAKGEYIAFVDADDAILPDWCERHLAAIHQADYVQSGYQRIDGRGSIVENPKTPHHRYQFTSPCMRLYQRKTIEGMRFIEGMIYEDVIWSVDLWLRGSACRMIDYTGYLYTLNPKSTTSKPRPEAQHQVLSILRQRSQTAPCRRKWIIYYTLIRLKLYFIFQ